MSNTLTVSMFDSTSTSAKRVHTQSIIDLKFSYSEHGCDMCVFVASVSQDAAAAILANASVYHVVISSIGGNVWAGRAEQVSIVSGGVEITAYGYWRALLDQPYTAMWSETKLTEWRLVDASDLANRIPSMYSTDTNDRLFIAPTKDSVYGTGTEVGEWGYQIPSGSSRQITAISFDWTANLPTDWYARVDRYTSAYSYQSTITTFLNPDDGAVSTGTVSQTFTACDRVHVAIYYGGGGTYTYTGETGTNNLQVANVRIKSTTASTVTPNAVIADMLSLAPALSSVVVSDTNSLDLTDAVFEDKYPGDIIDYIARLGDTTGNRWEAGVDANRVLYYRSRGSNVKEWYADLLDLDFAREISSMWNSVYAVYKRPITDTAVRGTASTDTASVNLWGVTRKMALPVDTTSSTTANYYRDVALADRKNPAVKTQLRVLPVNISDLWVVKAGDYINIRNLPPVIFGQLNFTRVRIARTEYDATNNTITIQSEAPLSQLEFIMGQRAAGVGVDWRKPVAIPFREDVRRLPDRPALPDYDADGNIPIRW